MDGGGKDIVTTWIYVCRWLRGWMAISAAASGCEMFASSAAPHRIGFSRADVRRAHGRSALSDLADRTQPAVHRRLQCPGAALPLRVRRPRNGSVSTVSGQERVRPPADLDGDRRDRLSGSCANKAVTPGVPPATIIGGRAAEPGRDHDLCAGLETPAQRQPRIEAPRPRREESS